MTDPAELSRRLRDHERETSSRFHEHGKHISRIEGVLEERTRTLERAVTQQGEAYLRLEQRFEASSRELRDLMERASEAMRKQVEDAAVESRKEIRALLEDASEQKADSSAVSARLALLWTFVGAALVSIISTVVSGGFP